MENNLDLKISYVPTTLTSNHKVVIPCFISFSHPKMKEIKLELIHGSDLAKNIPTYKLHQSFSSGIDLIPKIAADDYVLGIANLHIDAHKENKHNYLIRFKHKNEIIKEQALTPIHIQNFKNDKTLIAETIIALPTFNPNLDLFGAQISSIFSQTYKDWQLVIYDDCSEQEKFQAIKACLAKYPDNKYRIERQDINLGYYKNIESLFYTIYGESKFIALSDQDDFWYEHKLEKMIPQLGDEKAVYANMKIVSEEGQRIAKDFWNSRSNHNDHPLALLLSNTMTGSASIIQNKDLDQLLPFPVNMGKSFHDHWMALFYSSSNNLNYLDEILQDYVQHENNVTGFTGFNDKSLIQSILPILSMRRLILNEKISPFDSSNQQVFKDYLKVYFNAYLKRKYYALNLQSRLGTPLYDYFLDEKKLQKKLLKFILSKDKSIYTNNMENAIYNSLVYMKSIRTDG